MPPLVLDEFSASQKNYVQQLNNNNTAIMAAVNTLQAQVLAAIGEGSDLVLDAFDRPGFVGDASFQLDLENYVGANEMVIGRRPVADTGLGEVDESVVWGTFAGEKSRVKQIGDVTLDFDSVVVSGPTTVYVTVGSTGVPQLDLSDATANVVYLYSMTWDGFGVDLDSIKRLAPILPGYTLVQSMAGAPTQVRQLDSETDWLTDLQSASAVVLMGAPADNEIGINGQVEVLGFFLHCDKNGEDGFDALPGGGDEDRQVILRVVTDPGDVWSAADIEIDARETPDDFFVELDSSVQSRRFITEVTRFYLERVSVGDDVTSAQSFTWGVLVRPLFGTPVPKDDDMVGLI